MLGTWQRASRSLDAAEGYRALDTGAIEAWLQETLAGLGALRRKVRAIVPVTHGAAFAGLRGDALALPVPDYEFTGFNERPADWPRRVDPFEHSLSPVLPAGLNAATQLDWLQRHLPRRMAEVERWLPYPQYWAWWLCGVPASELSSLGCHTLLWRPREGRWSYLAEQAGWAQRFAPVRRAWETLGLLKADLASSLGLPSGVRVLCGAHDSNACLARYLRSWPRMTLVSTGTWVVVMAPGSPVDALDGRDDFLANVSVRGDVVPTGRFMGGREFERLAAGADPALADEVTLQRLVAAGVQAEADASAVRLADGRVVPASDLGGVMDPRERATLAALHTARQTACIVRELGAIGPLTVDGPFASNPVYLSALAGLVDDVHASSDPIEGTARGAWVLARWTDPRATPPMVVPVPVVSSWPG